MTDTITIDKKLYDNLIEARNKLEALQAGGVDNWSGYGDALRAYYRDHFGDDFVDEDGECEEW